MKAATFNANSIRMRLPQVLEWLDTHRPDLLGIQETKVQDHEFPKAEFEAIGYACAFRGQKSYNGVAILSLEPLTDIRYGFGPDESESTRLIRGVYRGVHVINTYVPQGREIDSEHYAGKLEWLRRLRGMFDAELTSDTPALWMGDLNVAPDPEDVYAPEELEGHVCFNRELTRVFREEVCAFGFEDLFRRFNHGPGHYTFFDYRIPGAVSRKMGWRIDHILGTPPMAARAIASRIDLEPRRSKLHKTSDHTFLVVDFATGA